MPSATTPPATAEVIPLDLGHAPAADYGFARARLEEILLRHTLLESYDGFAADGKPYPCADPTALLPRDIAHAVEHQAQRTALVFLLAEPMPEGLTKHFRLRGSNRASWANLKRLAPDLDLSDYKTAHCQAAAAQFAGLMGKLAPLDYALVVQPTANDAIELTHFHVKVERLIDNAIKQLARELGYIERRLFERGEDYVDALEAKYYEYYGFPPTASGRKSAAAMAPQLFHEHGLRFSVFAASQEDCRLCILDETDRLAQYMLIRATPGIRERLEIGAAALGGIERFIARRDADGTPVMLLRARFRRTAAAVPLPRGGKRADDDIDADWLAIDDLAVVVAQAPDASLPLPLWEGVGGGVPTRGGPGLLTPPPSPSHKGRG